MFEFENQIARFLSDHKIDYQFDEESHLMVAPAIKIHCVPILSDPELSKYLVSRDTTFDIRVWEDLYQQYGDILNSRIKSLLGLNSRIYARLTSVISISQKEADDFLVQNHLNQSTKAKYRYALESKGGIVAVATFGRTCPIQFEGRTYQSSELIRFCSKTGLTVVGGLSKLLKHFIRVVKPEHIMTYIDKEWSDGTGYKALGFRLVGESKPQEFWVSLKDGLRFSDREKDKNNTAIHSPDWLSITNLGNHKYIKLINNGS